jgi:hypothetical protein
LLEDASGDPFLEAVMGGRTRAKAGGVQGLPLTAGPQDEEDRFHTDTVGSAWPTTAEAMGVFVFRDQQGHTGPQVIWDVPLVHGRIHGSSGFHESTSYAQLSRNNGSCT